MTYKELINEVLVRLREETVVSDWSGAINDSIAVEDYQKVIGSLVNDAKRSIESYHDWLVLRETKNIDTVAGTKNYSLASGQEFKILDVVNNSTGNQLAQVSRTYLNSIMYPTDPTGEPNYYGFNGADSSNNLKVDLSPIPEAAQTISFDIVKYQDTLTDATTVVKIPHQPIILGAYARAIAERGEDGGTQSSIAAQEAASSLAQAVMMDSGNTKYENDWYVETNYNHTNR
jgi:hypothetical protein|tara:strand:- start:437 stop:1129 length:693 start_codon:yes stop_codon:yes gene_type:complete